METEARLTKLASCAGCGAKVGAGTLSKLLQDFKTRTDPRLIVGFDKSDDASVYVINDKTALIQASEMRLQSRIDRLVQAGKPAKTYVSAPTAVDKYHRTMNNTGLAAPVFVDNKRRK